ncbi:thermonuclease family protein [Candidatus Planktophila versatilis]|uniref:thermonuclease family protein n=1 Tax=Candidatus Planktophila versatilis TaxID=1884905 RepID=UPI000BAC82BA|nr:thermonuclease family protein [Candidatus Planktophila versatilis]ASY26186.1 micrococcal nuclease [Candidatus Planktophila versatilis]
MKKLFALASVILALSVSSAGSPASAGSPTLRVIDGDTITLSSGEKVRLLQIDTPELNPAECYGKEARSALFTLLNAPGELTLKSDPKLDERDRYGRLLRYVFVGKTNINLKLVEIGAAAPYFYRGERGQYSAQILQAALNAKAKSLGLWKACPSTRLTPGNVVTTAAVVSDLKAAVVSAGVNCDPNYAGCIPLFTSDLDCADIKRLGLAPVKVIGIDVHKLDRDGDRVGCGK